MVSAEEGSVEDSSRFQVFHRERECAGNIQVEGGTGRLSQADIIT